MSNLGHLGRNNSTEKQYLPPKRGRKFGRLASVLSPRRAQEKANTQVPRNNPGNIVALPRIQVSCVTRWQYYNWPYRVRRFYGNFYGCGADWFGSAFGHSTSVSASSRKAASLGSLGRNWSATFRHCPVAASASSWANAVAMKAETMRRPLLPAYASALRMKWTRHRCQPALNILRTVALMPYASRSTCPSATFGT